MVFDTFGALSCPPDSEGLGLGLGLWLWLSMATYDRFAGLDMAMKANVMQRDATSFCTAVGMPPWRETRD